jgi:Domain of unknown function (DUF1707)
LEAIPVATTSGRDPGLRVSDADRDTVVTELGRHFQDGRLDQNEFGERMGAALSAKTEGDLAGLLADLPRPYLPNTAQLGARPQAGLADSARTSDPVGRVGRRYGRPPLTALLPVAFAAFVIVGFVGGGWYHGSGWGGWGGWPFAPFGLLWLIIPILAIRARARGWRRRQWR